MDKKICFIVMPISDIEGYEAQHFSRVYEYLIKPACEAAGLNPVRADDVKSANHIVLDILEKIVSSALVICDLSGKNANVMYELGIRQAFDLPVVLLKDKRTERVFDIQGLRTNDYDETLRVDHIKADVAQLTSTIEATLNPASHDVNSLVRLLGVAKASVPEKADISSDTAVILKTLSDISRRITQIEESQSLTSGNNGIIIPQKNNVANHLMRYFSHTLPSGAKVQLGTDLYDGDGNELGEFIGQTSGGIVVRKKGEGLLTIPQDDERYFKISDVQF